MSAHGRWLVAGCICVTLFTVADSANAQFAARGDVRASVTDRSSDWPSWADMRQLALLEQ